MSPQEPPEVKPHGLAVVVAPCEFAHVHAATITHGVDTRKEPRVYILTIPTTTRSLVAGNGAWDDRHVGGAVSSGAGGYGQSHKVADGECPRGKRE